MSNHQPNAWQTAGRGRHSHSTSRTPQNRSGTASPAQTNPSQPPKDASVPVAPRGQPTQNVWTQRANTAGSSSNNNGTGNNNSSNGPPQPRNEAPATTFASRSPVAAEDPSQVPTNGFNVAEVKAFLAREPTPATYKLPDPPSASSAGTGSGGNNRLSGGAWGAGGAKANYTASNQPFFAQLAKQVAAFEGGG